MKIPRFLPPFKGIHFISHALIWIFAFNWPNAITFFPFVIYKNRWNRMNMITRNHETIHIQQQMECGLVGGLIYLVLGLTSHNWLWTLPVLFLFLWIYWINILVNRFRFGEWRMAYRLSAFEREAYNKANISNYHVLRRPFDWIRYF